MKKLAIILFGLGVCNSVLADSTILKFRDFTKKELKEVEEYQNEGSGDAFIFGTNQGLWYVYVEEPALGVFSKAADKNQCVKLTGTKSQLKGKYVEPGFADSGFKSQIVKCPKK